MLLPGGSSVHALLGVAILRAKAQTQGDTIWLACMICAFFVCKTSILDILSDRPLPPGSLPLEGKREDIYFPAGNRERSSMTRGLWSASLT